MKTYPIDGTRLVRAHRAWQQVNRALPTLSDPAGHALIASTKLHLAGPSWRDPLPGLPRGYFAPRAKPAPKTKRRGWAGRRGRR